MEKLTVLEMVACLAVATFVNAQDVLSVDSVKHKAEAGDAMAQAQYAQMLQTGQGVEKNEAEALKWYQKAADAGNSYAQANMGVFCQTGGCGATKDLAKAAQWYQKAAEQGNAYAQFYLAGLYNNGNGVKKNIKKSTELLEQAAKGGMAQAQVAYALRLYEGDGIDMDIDEALKWAEKAVAAGDGNAAKLVGVLKNAKEVWDKTPKSLLGVAFGGDITKLKSKYTYGGVETTKDGASLIIYCTPAKPFRKFKQDGRFQIYGTLDSKKIYKFLWDSERFPDGTSEQMANEEVLATCNVIAKKFGGELKKKGDVFEVKVGFMKVCMKAEWGYMTMTVVNEAYENIAKKEYEAKRAAQGDGSDAL